MSAPVERTSCGTKCKSGRSSRRGRPTSNAARERSRVKTLRSAFLSLQMSLPAVPPDTKLSKLDVLLLATAYISHLRRSLYNVEDREGTLKGKQGDSLRGRRRSGVDSRCEDGSDTCNVNSARINDGYGDTMDPHPVKKWPMRSRLYEGILDSVRVAGRDNVTKTLTSNHRSFLCSRDATEH